MTDPKPHKSSLIERAAEIYDFSAALKGRAAPAISAEPRSPILEAPPSECTPVDPPVAPPVVVDAGSVAPPTAPAPAPIAPPPVEIAAVPVAPPRPAPKAASGPRQTVNRDWLREQGYIVPDAPVSSLSEEFRLVKRQLLLAAPDIPLGERILVCSAKPGDGKTFCAINLAMSIAAERDSDVLLIDADFAKPSILSALGLEGRSGFMDALADPRIAIEDCVITTDIAGLSVLPAGSRTNVDTEHLASPRTVELLDRLTRDNPKRIVIFDSPPALAASPASELALHVGQAMLIVRADKTSETALRDALGLLGGCQNIRLLLNGTRFSPTGRSFGSYYGYGQ